VLTFGDATRSNSYRVVVALMAGCPPGHQTSQKDQLNRNKLNARKESGAYAESDGMLGVSDTTSSSPNVSQSVRALF